jgi:hypothetical protein
MYPEALLVRQIFAAMRECSGAAGAPTCCKIAACVAITLPGRSPFAAELPTEHGRSRLRMPPHWDLSRDPAWPLCAGHIPPLQHAVRELPVACTTAAPVPPSRANSRIVARIRFMTTSYHKRTFENKTAESNRMAWGGLRRKMQPISFPNTDDSSY